MTAVIPKVKVLIKKNQLIARPGMAGKVAIVGAFDSTETNPVLCESVDEAYTTFGTDTTYNGCKCIEPIFSGATSLLVVNYTTKSGSTVDKTLTTQKLSDCLAKIKGEDWDILFVAETLTDTFIPIIDHYLAECFEMKCPAGFIGVLNGQSTADNVASSELAGEHCYGLITQSVTVGNTVYDLLQTGAYYTGLVAGLNVANSMTYKILPNVTAISPEYTFESGDDGKTLVEAGITTFKCKSRINDEYIVVNSELPNGWDLYINRARDYVIREFALDQFLGERNRSATLSEIKQELDRVKHLCVETLDLLEDINYEVMKKDANCVDVYIDSMVFIGVITEIDVYVKIEVE